VSYDLVVIGMGSAGLSATEFATGLGLRVAVVERARVGGDCLWTGCVPSKALVASAKVAHTMRNAHRVGIASVEPVIDLPTVWRRARAVQAEIAATDDNPHRYRQMGAELFTGQARLTADNEVTVQSDDGTHEVLATRFVLLCSGSRPRIPAIIGLSTDWCLTSETLFQLNAPPSTLAIIGGGPMGVEMAQTLQRLGVEVTVFQRAHTLLPRSETSLVSRLTEILAQEGVVVHTTADVRACVRRVDGLVDVEASVGHDGKQVQLRVAGVLVAAGRTANTDDLGLQEQGIEVTERGIQVDDRGRTAVRTVYAAGDAAGRQYQTNSAGYEAVRAVRDMFFPGKGSVDAAIPSCVFSDPELASVGLTVDQAEEQFGTDSDSWRIDLAHNDRARTDAHPEGAVVVVTAKGRIVGAHLLAPGAGEMIHELSLAIQRELRLEELAAAVHVYPTVAGAIGQLANESAYEKAHRLRWMMKRR